MFYLIPKVANELNKSPPPNVVTYSDLQLDGIGDPEAVCEFIDHLASQASVSDRSALYGSINAIKARIVYQTNVPSISSLVSRGKCRLGPKNYVELVA
jgi:hypothetical protein